jgi:beta-galactosidase
MVGSANRSRLFNDDWKFIRDCADGAEAVSFDDSQWLTVDLPHDFSLMDLPGGDSDDQTGPFSKQSPGGNSSGHVMGGTGWYRKTFTVDEKDDGKIFTLQFDGAYMESEVWVNGKETGVHKNGYTPFAFNITSALNAPGEKNVVAVRVNNTGVNSRWYSGSGLYRNVHLLVTHPVHVANCGIYVTTPEVTADKASVNVNVQIRNEQQEDATVQVAVTLFDKNGKNLGGEKENVTLRASSENTFQMQLEVEKPQLWSVDAPSLYQAEILIKQGDNVLDACRRKFGIRTIEITADKGLLLNGESILMRGGCMHHDNGFLGAAAIDRAEYHRVEIMKANGFNALRCSHNAPSETFLNACDELGILVIDEFTDMWNLYKNRNDYSRFFDEYWEQDLTDMIMRDRNHPSVILWSIGNEIPKMNIAEGVRIGTMLKNKVKQLDPIRGVTEAVAGFLIHGGWKNSKDYLAVLDVCGYNYLQQTYADDHRLFPDRVMYGSETYPMEAYENWKAAEENPYVIGDFVWTSMDYIGEVLIGDSKYVKELDTRSLQGWDWTGMPEGTNPSMVFDMMNNYSESRWPAYLSWCGDIDIIGEKKPQGRYRDVLWDRCVIEMNVHEPIPTGMVESISSWGWPREWPSWSWPGCEGQPLQVRVFTKAPQVKLMLNGQLVGEKIMSEADKFIASFDVPYQSGQLTAIAVKNGKEIGKKVLATAGEPQSVRLTADRNRIKADRNDLAFVKIEVVDKDGQVVPTNDIKVTLSVTGDGELVASGNADPYGMESANRPVLRVYRGQAQAIIRPFAKCGKIGISVESEGLVSSELNLIVQ